MALSDLSAIHQMHPGALQSLCHFTVELQTTISDITCLVKTGGLPFLGSKSPVCLWFRQKLLLLQNQGSSA